LSALVLYSYYCNIDFLRFTIRQSVHENLYSGFNFTSSDACEITASPQKIDLYGDKTDSIEYTKKWWGCYQVVGVRSFRKGISENMLCLTGTSFGKDTALVLTENNKPIAVAGKTELRGLCFIPKAGTKPAHIEGESFWGDKVIDGAQMQAPQQLPDLNPVIYKQVEELNNQANEDSLITLDQIPDADTIKNSFLSKTLRIIAGGTISLDNIGLSGNIVVQSPKRIIVNKGSILENVLLNAPVIEIKEGFSGTLQALAVDSIIVGDEVSLSYPSSLLLINKPVIDTAHKNIPMPALLVGEKCIIKGTLAACIKGGNITNKIYLKLGKESQVQGMVYSQGYLDVQGTITGAAYAKGFILNTRSGVYEQHLLNAVIDRKSLSDFFVAGALFEGKSPNKIVKWVN
jgi:hypothetical protein